MVGNTRHLGLQSTNQEVNSIRLELDVTNKKLKEISIIKDVCTRCQDSAGLNKFSEEKSILSAQNRQLQKEIANLKQQINNSDNRHREAIAALKSDRDRLRADKNELLSQIQETQKTIDDKEEQLREFIREFHQQMKENDDLIREADAERICLRRERNDISRKNQDLTEVVSTLRGELMLSERRIRELECEISALRQPSSHHPEKRRSLHFTVDSSLSTNRAYSMSVATDPNPSMHIHDPLLIPSSPLTSRVYIGPNGSAEAHSLSSAEDVSGDLLPMPECLGQPHKLKSPTLVQHLSGSLSKAFRRGRNRKSFEFVRASGSLSLPRHSSFSIGCLSPDVETFLEVSAVNPAEWTDEEKHEILSNSEHLPMQKWKADTVLVWLDRIMHMGQYLIECRSNIKSGKVLLTMTESELSRCLGISDPLQSRKLFLAISEFQNSSATILNTSPAGRLDHWWVCEQWLRDIGMTQYSSRFREHLIDGRVLASLTKKDLEKFMGMEGRKVHQESVLRGVQLLNMLQFNNQRLDERRQMCEDTDSDLLVWNNSRLIQWTKSIDLKEYSTNLKDSGVHGALIVLDYSFTSDDMATALGIPINKATVRRHLASEYDTLVKKARDSLRDEVSCSYTDNGKKASFSRSGSTSTRLRRSLKSSLNRTLGRQHSKENQPSVK